MKILSILILASLFIGCTGGTADTAFRSRVESAEIQTTVSSDKSGNYGGTVGTKLNFRDPRTRDNK